MFQKLVIFPNAKEIKFKKQLKRKDQTQIFL